MAKLPYPSAVIFDWDNTLVDNWGTIAEALNTALVADGQQPWTLEEVKQRAMRALRESFPVWFGDRWEKAREVFYDKFLAIHLDYLQPLPQAAELLTALREANIPLYIVSNKRGDVMRREVAHLGWGQHFVACVGSFDATLDKPHPEPVELALGKGGLKIGDKSIWFVGDTHVDIECANNTGCTAILIHNVAETRNLQVDAMVSNCQDLQSLFYDLTSIKNKTANGAAS
jgi:phosphoglycolate phosphatase